VAVGHRDGVELGIPQKGRKTPGVSETPGVWVAVRSAVYLCEGSDT